MLNDTDKRMQYAYTGFSSPSENFSESSISLDEYLTLKNKKNTGRGRDAPTTGTINNINIFIRFSDESEFGTARYIMDELFNKSDGPSLSHYYDEVSYSQLEVITTVT